MNHAHLYCKTLDQVTKEELVDALHHSLMQLKATSEEGDWDHEPAIIEASRCLTKAGHIGFIT